MSETIQQLLIVTLGAMLGAAIAVIPNVLVGYAALVTAKKSDKKLDVVQTEVAKVHDSTNSKMTELLQVTKAAAHAEGRAEGVKDEKYTQATAKSPNAPAPPIR